MGSDVRILGRAAGMLVATSDDVSFNWFLTECCHASAKGSDSGIVCRSCYNLIDVAYGGVYDKRFHGPIVPLDS